MTAIIMMPTGIAMVLEYSRPVRAVDIEELISESIGEAW
jgi:hypothetical protein